MRYEIGQVLKRDLVMKLVNGRCAWPKQILGRHLVPDGQIITAYHPYALRMRLQISPEESYEMEMAERQPVFALFLPHQNRNFYRLEMYLRDGEKVSFCDPYCFPCQITQEEEQAFLQGKWMNAYEKLGCHPMEIEGIQGMYFAVWASQAESVSVVGDFNHWDGRLCPMNRMEHSGIYEIFLPEVKEGEGYLYEIQEKTGQKRRMTDPYGIAHKCDNTSKMLNMNNFVWKDEEWMEGRKQRNLKNEPVIISNLSPENMDTFYDVHEENFTHILLDRKDREERFRFVSNIAGSDFFVPPVCEEEPDCFREMIQKAHKKNVGVLMEISMKAIPCEKPQAAVFFLSNLLFWIKEYHIDGFAFDGFADNYGSWRERFKNAEAIEEWDLSPEEEDCKKILRSAVELIRKEAPGVMMIADRLYSGEPDDMSDSSEKLFDFYWNYHVKWNLDGYLSQGRAGRQREHFRLTLPLQKPDIAASIHVLEYKNVNNLNQTSIDKLGEVYYDMISEAKLSYAFLMGIPGKKMVPDSVNNVKIRDYLYSLLELYRRYPALYECGEKEQVFEWVNGMDAVASVISFIRKSGGSAEHFLFICNFSTEALVSYRVGVPSFGKYRLLISSDAEEYGGKGRFVRQRPSVCRQPCDFLPYSMAVSLPPESVLIFGFGPVFHSV